MRPCKVLLILGEGMNALHSHLCSDKRRQVHAEYHPEITEVSLISDVGCLKYHQYFIEVLVMQVVFFSSVLGNRHISEVDNLLAVVSAHDLVEQTSGQELGVCPSTHLEAVL